MIPANTGASQVAPIGKNLLADAGHVKDRVQSLGWEDPRRRTRQPTPVFLPGESPWTVGPGGLQSIGSQRIGHN